MNTFSIHFNFSNSGFDLNFFNQFDTYFSYKFTALLAVIFIALRVRKVIRMKKRASEEINFPIVTPVKSDNPFENDWSL